MGRHKGEGTKIYWRNGRAEAQITIDGKRYIRYGRTVEEVKSKIEEVKGNAKQGLPVPPARETLGAFLTRWLRDVASVKVKRTTLIRYTADVEHHIKPALGTVKLREVTPQRVQKFIAELAASGLSPRSVAHCRAVLRVALAQAQREGAIGQNAAKLVTVPRQLHKHVRALGPSDAVALLDAFKGDEIEQLVTLALATGMRQGELLGLGWNDVDMDAATLRVHRQLQRIDGEYILTGLKTDRSRRTLALPAIALSALRAQQQKQAERKMLLGPEWINTGRMFTTVTGSYLNGPSLTHRFQVKLKEAGLEPMHFHDLRHGAASLLLSQGADMRRIQEQLGHSTIILTANTYAHVVPELMKDNADLLQRALSRSTA